MYIDENKKENQKTYSRVEKMNTTVRIQGKQKEDKNTKITFL